MDAVLHAHSGLRYVVLALLLVAILIGLKGWLGNNNFTGFHKKINLFTLISIHIQLLLGIILYFTSSMVQFNEFTMKTEAIRFFTVEHSAGMILAVILATIGKKKVDSANVPRTKFKRMFIFYLITLIIIFVSIPWPFLKPELFRGWF